MLNKFIPKYHVKSIYKIDYDKLYDDGIRLVMFDLDNTLITYNETMPNAKLKELKRILEKKGFEVILVSNSKKARVETFAQDFNINYVKFAKKPLKKGFKEALIKTRGKYEFNQVCEIGDQVMTDVFGSNRMKFISILVDPIDKKSEKLPTKFNRFLESCIKFLLKIFKNKKYQKAFNEYSGEYYDC